MVSENGRPELDADRSAWTGVLKNDLYLKRFVEREIWMCRDSGVEAAIDLWDSLDRDSGSVEETLGKVLCYVALAVRARV